MIKQFSAGDITIRPFGTFKHWNIQSVDSGGLDQYGYSTYYSGAIEINEGRNLTSIFYPTSSAFYVAANEPINASGKYARNVYSLTNSMFYKYSADPLKAFGIQEHTQNLVTGDKEVRNINDRITVATLKHNAYGDSIAPQTVKIIDQSNIHQTYTVYDDGYTNLRLSGSCFPITTPIGGVRDLTATPYWVPSSGSFYVTFNNGSTAEVNEQNAKYYMEMGLSISYVPPTSGDDWALDQSTARDYFQANNEHFGEAVSSWYKYLAVGSTMDDYSLSANRFGYVGLFKYDDAGGYHRLVRQINFPFTQSADTSSSFQDSFGYSVAVRDNFLAAGSPIGLACNTTDYPGFVCVYDKAKGGVENWGIVNMLKGETSGDRFGNAVSIDNDILAVGAPHASGSEGLVYIFRRKKYMNSGSCDNIPTGSTWQQVVTAADFCAELETGSYIASQSSTPTFVSGNFSWEFETKLSSSVAATGDKFGWCLEASDDKLIVGTYKSGLGYATLFACSYYSASLGECPTASWSEVKIYKANAAYADLDRSSGLYLVDVSDTLSADLYGSTVAMNGNSIVIGSYADRAFKPYDTYPSSSILGAAYFYRYGADPDCIYYKTFGGGYITDNHFAYKVAIDGTTAAVTSLPNTLARTVDYSGSAYLLENYTYESSGSEDAVLGRVTVYNDSSGTGSWGIVGDLKRNKEAEKPYNIYGYSVSLCSDFLAVGAPLVNTASVANYSDIIDLGHQTASMASSYSGSVFVYGLAQYQSDQLVGNVFYKNGYIVLTNTSSNYSGMLLGTGSRGFTLDYQGAHTIYEHEYLVSIRPGEFNYSTNPSSLVQNPLAFDVNQDGVFDYLDVDLVMRYLRNKKFYTDSVFDEAGIILEQNAFIKTYNWWGTDLLLTEAEDVLLQENSSGYMVSSSLNVFTKAAFDYIEENLVATSLLDIDGDGQINLNDGNILALYYFDTLTPVTLVPQLSQNSQRKYVKDISTYLDQYCSHNVSKVNPEFFGYQASSSYDPTGSFLAPFVTTIGLYDNNELVAVGKLGRPIKNLVDWPVNFIVRFDT